MTELTEAVEAGAQALLRYQFPDAVGEWDVVPTMTKHTLREIVTPIIAAAAPFIEAQR